MQKEKILLKRKILAVERENKSLSEEIGGLEKQPLSTHSPNQLRTPHAGLPVGQNVRLFSFGDEAKSPGTNMNKRSYELAAPAIASFGVLFI